MARVPSQQLEGISPSRDIFADIILGQGSELLEKGTMFFGEKALLFICHKGSLFWLGVDLRYSIESNAFFRRSPLIQ